jgi:ribosome maturation factor RimP
LTPEIETELAEIAAATGCELINAEWKGGILRLILDRQPDPIPTTPLPASDLPDGQPSAASESPESMPDSKFTESAESAESEAAAGSPTDLMGAAVSGISLGDCEHVAKLASGYLDMLDFGQGRYVLEVSSPGLDRQLYRPSDYERFVGRLARVTYEVPPAAPAAAGSTAASSRPGKRTVVARLAGAGGGQVTMVDEATGERLTLPLQTIRLARLEVEL